MNNVVQTGYLTEDAKITPPKGNASKMATFSMGYNANSNYSLRIWPYQKSWTITLDD